MTKKINIGVLVSGSGSNLQAIMDACKTGRINGSVAFVGSDRPNVYGLERAERCGIPTFVVDYAGMIRQWGKSTEAAPLPDDYREDEIGAKIRLFDGGWSRERIRSFLTTRVLAEAALLEKMSRFSFDLLVLAGFMRNLTPYFIDRINTNPKRPKIMNIHPALLPAFPGVDGYGDTFRYGSKVGGCTVHFIDYGEDSGPIIGQKCFAIEPDDTIDTVREKGLKLEWELYPEAIQLYAKDRLELLDKTFSVERNQTLTRRIVRINDPDL